MTVQRGSEKGRAAENLALAHGEAGRDQAESDGSGWFAVWFLVGYLKTRSLRPFVVYRLLLALVIVAVLLRA